MQRISILPRNSSSHRLYRALLIMSRERNGGFGRSGKRPVEEVADKIADLDKDSEFKRVKHSNCKTMAEECQCPITHNLPVDPVTASDGKVYERRAIMEYIKRQGKNVVSPCTRLKMQKTVHTALFVLNIIENGIEAGVYDGELAETWKVRMGMKILVDEQEKKAREGDTHAMRTLAQWYEGCENDLPKDDTKAKQWRKMSEWLERAEAGDADAMYNLGEVFRKGSHGQKKDANKSYRWYERASDAGSVKGTANVGFNKIYGTGTRKNVGVGLMLLMSAAKDESDVCCFYLGKFYYLGTHGVEMNQAKAKHWLSLAVGSTRHAHLEGKHIRRARWWIRRIQQNELPSSDEEDSSSDEENSSSDDDNIEFRDDWSLPSDDSSDEDEGHVHVEA